MQKIFKIAYFSIFIFWLSEAVIAENENTESSEPERYLGQTENSQVSPETGMSLRRYAQAQNNKSQDKQKDKKEKSDKKEKAAADTSDSDSDSDSDSEHEADSGSGSGSKAKGNERSTEMKSRRDERKEIQEEYRAGDKGENQSGKKPWWKFWENEPE